MPVTIGIRKAMPRGFVGQFVQPFRSRQALALAAKAGAAALPGRRAL